MIAVLAASKAKSSIFSGLGQQLMTALNEISHHQAVHSEAAAIPFALVIAAIAMFLWRLAGPKRKPGR